MKITYWSDFACPFCYIGIARLKRALRELGMENQVEWERKSFQLRKGNDYGSCPTCGNVKQALEGTNGSHFQQKYRLSESGAKSQFDEMYRMGLSEGLEIHYDTAPLCYTEDAHRLVKYVKDAGGDALASLVTETLFYMYLTKNMDISDHRVLLDIGKAVGLQEEGVISLLNSDDYGAEVMMDGIKADMYGIHVVPHFIVNGKYAIEGAQEVEIMKKTLLAAR